MGDLSSINKKAYSLKMKVKSLSHVQLFVTPWTVAYQAPLSIGFSRQEYLSGLPFPSPGDLPNPGIEPGSLSLQADALPSEPPGKEALMVQRVKRLSPGLLLVSHKCHVLSHFRAFLPAILSAWKILFSALPMEILFSSFRS